MQSLLYSYTEFTIIDIKYRVTCGELNFHGNTINSKNILSLIAWIVFYVFNNDCDSSNEPYFCETERKISNTSPTVVEINSKSKLKSV